MASSYLKQTFLLPKCLQMQTVRFNRNRINIQKPRPPHFDRAKMLAACKPIYPKKPEYVCLKGTEKRTKDDVYNPFKTLLAKDVKNWFEHSNFIGFLHMCPFKSEDQFKIYVQLKREGVVLKAYGKAVVAEALTDTKYEPVLQLFVSRNAMLFSEKAESVAKVLKILKRVPQMVLMAGIVEGTLMSRAQLERYAALPDITTARAQLVSLLSGAASPAARLVSNLNSHQQNLVSNLDQRIKQLTPESESQE